MGVCCAHPSQDRNQLQIDKPLVYLVGKPEDSCNITKDHTEVVNEKAKIIQAYFRGFMVRKHLGKIKVSTQPTLHLERIHSAQQHSPRNPAPKRFSQVVGVVETPASPVKILTPSARPQTVRPESSLQQNRLLKSGASNITKFCKPVNSPSQEIFRPRGTHLPDQSVATKLKQTPTDYPLIVQQTLFKVGPFKYQEYINKPQSKFFTPSVNDKYLPFLEPYKMEDGNIYIGQWKQGQRQGKGKFIWTNGSVYDGYQKHQIISFWKDGERCGMGRLIHVNGDYYVGDWNHDKCSGYGQYLHADGTIQKGEWKDNLQNGPGEEILPDGTTYKGSYVDGKKCGYGTYQWADGSTYEGHLKDNMFHGYGEYKWPDGRYYKGEWLENKMHGKGNFSWPDGRKYQGEYLNDLKHGNGRFRFPDGREYLGEWQQGKMHGEGEMRELNGQRKKGIWVNGKQMK